MSVAAMLAGAAPERTPDWHSIDWKKIWPTVRRLQASIVKAVAEGRWNKVKAPVYLLTYSFSGRDGNWGRKLGRGTETGTRLVFPGTETGTRLVFPGDENRDVMQEKILVLGHVFDDVERRDRARHTVRQIGDRRRKVHRQTRANLPESRVVSSPGESLAAPTGPVPHVKCIMTGE